LSGGEAAVDIPKRLIDSLNQNRVAYEILHHPEAVTAQRIAQAEHVKGRHHAKVVMLKAGGKRLMAVLPADRQIDLQKVEKLFGKPASLDKEEEFKTLFPDCAIGAMPPFGNLYGLPTWVDKHLAEQDYIVFEAGTHTDAIKMSYRDYEKIAKPTVEDLSVKIQPMKGVKSYALPSHASQARDEIGARNSRADRLPSAKRRASATPRESLLPVRRRAGSVAELRLCGLFGRKSGADQN